MRNNTQVVDNSYMPWERNEDRRILAKRRPDDYELSEELGRSVIAIRTRRSRLLNRPVR
jgi:hypothetical protein